MLVLYRIRRGRLDFWLIDGDTVALSVRENEIPDLDGVRKLLQRFVDTFGAPLALEIREATAKEAAAVRRSQVYES